MPLKILRTELIRGSTAWWVTYPSVDVRLSVLERHAAEFYKCRSSASCCICNKQGGADRTSCICKACKLHPCIVLDMQATASMWSNVLGMYHEMTLGSKAKFKTPDTGEG